MKNPFKNIHLDTEEKEVNQAIESDKVTKLPLTTEEKKRLKRTAAFTLDKTKNINIRLSVRDLLALKTKAAVEGVPYQTLVASIIHKFTNNQLD